MDPTEAPDEYILQYLTVHNGFAHQQDLVHAHQWDASTVSRRLTQLEQAGYIERYPLGREKIVCLPECVPEYLIPTDGG